MKTKNLVMIVVAVLLVAIGGAFALAANSGDSSKPSTASSAGSSPKSNEPTASNSSNNKVAAATVNIKDYMFAPMQTTVKVGDTVTFTNMDDVHHSVIADKASADAPNGPLLAKGESYNFTFTKSGSYAYHCGPHTYMHGTVVVE